MDAKTIASLPPKLLAQYLRDPQLQMAMQYQQEGADTSPVQHWTQGAARLVKGLLGGIQANGIQEQYGKQAQNAATERQMALSQALGRPAETQQVGDRTINWQAQQPNLMSAAANLQSPDNADLAEKFLGAQLSQNQTAQNQAFQQAQQERMFAQQREMNNEQLNRQLAFEKYKMDNDPKRQFMMRFLNSGGGQNPPLPQPLPQPKPQNDIPAPPASGQLPAGIQLDQTRQQATAQPMPEQAQGNVFDPRATMVAQMFNVKPPEGYGLDANLNPVKMPQNPYKAEGDLRGEFQKQEAVKQAGIQGAYFKRMVDVYKNINPQTDTGAGDIALVFSYMKMLDPTSTVREGEYATAESAGGAGAQVANFYNKILQGQRLTPAMRQDFLSKANDVFQGANSQLTNVRGQYQNLAQQYGVDPNRATMDVLGGVKPMKRFNPSENYESGDTILMPDGSIKQVQ